MLRQHGQRWEVVAPDPAHGPVGLAYSPCWPPARADQVRRLLLSWLLELRMFPARRAGGQLQTWDFLLARPELFLTGVVQLVNNPPLDLGAPWPPPIPPYVPDAQVTAPEVVDVVSELVDAGAVTWTTGPGGPATGRWVLVLTDHGVRLAEADERRYADDERSRLRQAALMRWIATQPSGRRTPPLYLHAFLGSPSSVVDGMASTAQEGSDAYSRLTAAGFLCEGPRHPPNLVAGFTIGVTERGTQCIDDFGGDPMATPPPAGPGPDQRVYITNSQVGALAAHATHVVQTTSTPTHDTVDVEALRRFADAVAQALPAIAELTAVQRAAAATATAEITRLTRAPEPDHPRLRALGRSLRTIIEATTTNAVTAWLLGIWNG
jgi:hypothetical protein